MKKSLLTILCTLLSTISWAQGTTAGDSTAVAEPYAVLSADSLTVTFYYDNQKSARGGMDINNSYIDDGNSSPYGTATMAVFDASFANYLPTSTAYWFQRCNLLTEIRGLSNLNSANVTNMRFMFDNCSSLTNLDMSGFNTTNVTDMVLLFAGCSALTSLDLSGLNTTNVTEMNWMFDGCSSLTSLDVSGFNTANVTNMSGMFHECSSLTSLDLSGFNTANVTNMSWMFERCSALTNIYVSSTWTTSQVTANNGSNMFNECVNLVGGAGTTFSADHTDYTYAHIDGGTSNPGYFTDKNAPPVVDEDLKDDVYTVGETDFSTEFYTQFSKYYQIPQGGKWVSKFKLNLNPNDNRIYKNFVLLITNDEDRGAGQYKEYGAFRYDAVADSTRTNSQWGTSYVFPFQYTTSTLYLEPDENEMDPNVQKLGGLVTLTVDRSQADAFVITMSNEQGVVKTYHQPYVLPNFNNDSTNSNIRCYITVENSQIEFKGSNIEPIGGYSAPVATVEPYAVLNADNTVLTFYYDNQKEANNGMSVGPFDNYGTVSWYANRGTITKVVFDESFANCTSLTSTTYWFYQMRELTTIEGISNFKTDNVTSMGSMFRGCSGLTSLDVSGFNTANVTDMNRLFGGCSGLTSLDVSGFNTANVTDMTGMFGGCSGLTSLNVSGFNTANVTDMTGMFCELGGAEISLDLSSFNTSNVTSMESMFDESRSLKRLNLSSFNTSNVTNMKSMFAECSGLTSIDLSSFNTSNVTNVNGMFWGCSALTTIYAGNKWSTEKVTDGSRMFRDCTSLVGGAGTVYDANHIDQTYARIDGGPNSTTPGYFTDKDATSKVATPTFSWNEHTLTVSSATEGATIVYNNLKENPVMVEGEGILLYHTYTYTDPLTIIENAKLLFWAQKDGMANSDSITLNYPYTAWVALTDTLTKAKGIYDLALNNANVPDQMKSELASAISVGDSIYQVRNSSVDEIQSVTNRISVIANEVASLISAEDEPYAVLSENNTILTFYYDKQKTARHGVDMLGWQSTSETITTVNFDTSFAGYRPTSTQGWFAACYALTTINGMENLVTDDVTTMDGMFEVCRSLTSLNLTTFNTANVTSMYMMFRNCSSLTTVDLSSFNTAKVANMSCMFMDNSVLTTIYIGSGWSTAAVTSGDYVFSGCTNLMGGAGTSYDANHVDYTYARIDGGPNSTTPGYFTDKNAPITVAAPEFRFEGDNLTMTTETQNAGIFYKVAELPSMAEAVVESVVNSLIVTVDGQSTYYDQPFELKKAAVVKAIAIIRNETATFVSDTTTMVYDYQAWVNLKAAVESGTDLYGRAQGNPNVDTQLLEDLQWALNEGDMIYNNRAQMDSFEATHFTQRINELCAQIEAQMTPTEQVATPNFSWQNDELTISTTTEGADIYYWLSDVDVNGDGVITDADYAHYNNPLTIQRDVTIKAYAAKQAMDNSEIRTLDYPYTSWQTLREVISYASSVADRARHSAKVPDQEVASFEEDIAASYDMYEHRTETKDRVEEVARYLSERAYEIERMMEVEATFVDGVLTIEGNTTVAEALESFGVSTVTESIAAIVYNSSVPMANSDLQAITNPNLLIYVKSDSLAPADRNNIIVDGFAKNIVLTDVAQGNNDFYCPQSFTAEAISYTREFKQKTQIGVSRGWETIALPFNVQTIMHETRGLITPFGNNRSNSHFWLRRLTHDGLQSDSIIEANTAYLISMPNSEEYIADYNLPGRVTFSAENATVPMTEIVKDESADYVMTPCFTNAAAKQGIYVLNVGEERSGYPEGSIFESNYRAVLPFQAYVEHKGSNPAPPYFIVGDLGGDTTGIDATLMNSERVNSEAWYTLDGRKLQGKPTQKGVYITNGKKVIIK
jgi:surface protein